MNSLKKVELNVYGCYIYVNDICINVPVEFITWLFSEEEYYKYAEGWSTTCVEIHRDSEDLEFINIEYYDCIGNNEDTIAYIDENELKELCEKYYYVTSGDVWWNID